MIKESHKADLWDILWENAIGGLAIISEDGTFERVNPAFCRIVEYSEYELQQMKFQDITLPSDVDADVELSSQVKNSQRRSYDMIKSYMTKTRRVVWVHLRVIGYSIEGKFHYFISQVFEVPVSIVNQMGIDSRSRNSQFTQIQPPKKNKFSWKAFREWLPIVAMAVGAFVVGVGFIAGLFSPGAFPIP